MKAIRWMLPLLLMGLLPFTTGCDLDDDDTIGDDTNEFSVQLVGENEVPLVATPGRGDMTVELDDDDILTIDGSFENLVSELRSIDGSPIHVHVGTPNETGAIIFPVDVDANDDNRSGTFSLTEELDPAQVRVFEDGEYYLNIHTNAYPDGELRGQLAEDTPEFEGLDQSWGIELSSEAQPHTVTTDAEGWFWAILRDDETFAISGAVTDLTSDLVEVNLERGDVDETGSMILNLFTEETADGYRFFTSDRLTDEQVDDLRDGLYYLNVITADYPEGELRGQLDDENGFFFNFWEDIGGSSPDDPDQTVPY